MNNNYGVIMAGGIGSRFWPLSTEEKPKQFLDFLGTGTSLLQMTFDRLAQFIPKDQIYILTNKKYAALVLEQLPDIREAQLLCEPQRKNTAPCIAYAAAKIFAQNENGHLIVCPSDHLILENDRFQSAIMEALKSSENGRIATLGIKPTRPDTGYGYIEFDINSESRPLDVLRVNQFREKPNLQTAEQFVSAGNFYWNAGIFVWKASTIKESLEKYQTELATLFFGNPGAMNSTGEQEFIDHCFSICEDISIDYAVMERADNIDVVLTDFTWSDLGTWGSLATQLPLDRNANSRSESSIHLHGVHNTLVHLKKGTKAIIEGLEGYIIVSADDRLLIIRKENEQALKEFLKEI